MAEQEAWIRVEELRKSYRMGQEVVHALDGVNLHIPRGELVCLLGPSGSGKSTLLNALAGLEKPTSGAIWIGGIRIDQLNEQEVTLFRSLNVGFVFQSYNLLPTLTALENVSLGLIFKGWEKKKREVESAKMLERVGLAQRLHHLPRELSGGQQQRVAIARAFVGNPALLFADEPTGNLDSKTSRQVMSLMKQLIRDQRQTMIMVTHDEEMAAFADHTFHMRDGRIEQELRKESEMNRSEDQDGAM